MCLHVLHVVIGEGFGTEREMRSINAVLLVPTIIKLLLFPNSIQFNAVILNEWLYSFVLTTIHLFT